MNEQTIAQLHYKAKRAGPVPVGFSLVKHSAKREILGKHMLCHQRTRKWDARLASTAENYGKRIPREGLMKGGYGRGGASPVSTRITALFRYGIGLERAFLCQAKINGTNISAGVRPAW